MGPPAARRQAGAPAARRTPSGLWPPPPRPRPRAPRRAARTRAGTCGSWRDTCASSRSSSRISFSDSESRRSSESRLKLSPSTATLRSRSEPSSRALRPFTRNSGTVSWTRDTASSIPGALERSSEKAKSLRRQAPAVKPGRRHAAARVVVVDQLDYVEHVRVVLLALHHQQVRQRELRVAQDVGPDLRQLRLHRRGAHDLRAEHLEQVRSAVPRALADAADDARQSRDLLEEVALGDPLGHVRDEDVLANRETAPLLDVARRPTRWCRARRSSAGSSSGPRAARAAGRRSRCGSARRRSRCGRRRACRA